MNCERCNTETGCPDMVDYKYEPSLLYWHEALDRAHVVRDHFFEYVEQHLAVMNDEELKAKAEKVTLAMGAFYQLVGDKYHEFETSNPDPVKAELIEALDNMVALAKRELLGRSSTGTQLLISGAVAVLEKAGIQD